MYVRPIPYFVMCLLLLVAATALGQTKKRPQRQAPAASKQKKTVTDKPGKKDSNAGKATAKEVGNKAAEAIPTEKKSGDGDAAKRSSADEEQAKKPSKKPSKKIRVTWLGHAAFEIVSGEGTTLLIDPFLSQNPSTPEDKKALGMYAPDAILVTHSHADHLGDAVAISRKSGAPVIGSHDLVKSLKLKDDRKMGGNVGGKHVIKDVEVHIVPAMHGSAPGGRPVGFVLKFSTGQVVYHTGDTWIFGDMALINEIHKPKIILMNCGGGPYTQDPKTCALATKKYFKKAKTIIPMHFGTFPPLASEEDVTKGMKKYKKKLKILKPGESVELKK